MNFVIFLAILIYLLVQFLAAVFLIFKFETELIQSEKNEAYRDIIASVIFSVLCVYVYSEKSFRWLAKTPIEVIFALIVFGSLQILRKKIQINVEDGVKNTSFINYSWLLTKFSGVILIGTAIFCLLINLVMHDLFPRI